MKKLIIYSLFLLSSHMLCAQSENITLSFEELSLKEVLLSIEVKTELSFYYIDKWLDSKKISKNYEEVSLEFILNDLFTGSLHKLYYF
ncbi:hypothetical protein N7U66_02310 [Lacinutrix neustonica]|uniref:Uncharacterized protein n=1 Tax=Lacinutrix neustonica TaxID=2980107 RepID=A0A9E8SHC2_9FLAO|nr:hypothetical protein [Lacinutrix neustonica]WAC02555.1 hypothetical protein N7U66_02310 [Lacinutrix neustonica]